MDTSDNPTSPSPSLPESEYPNAARIYDYTIGGSFNVEADRQAAEYMFSLVPSTRKWVKMLREFLHEVAAEMYDQGFRQFLDLGSGLPTEDHIHSAVPEASVIYVDNDPTTVTYGQEMVAKTHNAYYVQGDLRDIDAVLQSDTVKRVIKPEERVAIGLSGVLVFLTRPEIQALAQSLYDWAPDGSVVYITIETKELGLSTEKFEAFINMFSQAGSPMYLISLEENIEMMKPWRLTRIEPVAGYLGKPSGYITEEDREAVGLEFYAAIFSK